MSKPQRFLVWVAFSVGLLFILGAVEFRHIYLSFREKQIALHEPSIAFGAYRCLADNKITGPQTEEQMARLLYGGSPKGYYYLFMSKGLDLSDDKTTIRNDFFHINYWVHFDGTNIVVRTDNADAPYVLDVTK